MLHAGRGRLNYYRRRLRLLRQSSARDKMEFVMRKIGLARRKPEEALEAAMPPTAAAVTGAVPMLDDCRRRMSKPSSATSRNRTGSGHLHRFGRGVRGGRPSIRAFGAV